MTAHTSPSLAIRIVLSTVEEIFYYGPEHLLGPARTADVAFARQVGMATLVDQFHFTYQAAASAFNRSDHGTAMHACHAIQWRAEADPYKAAKLKLFLSALARRRRSYHASPISTTP